MSIAESHPPVSGVSIGDYLIRRLQDFGVRDVFGIPGDYVLTFYAMLEKSPLRLVGCTREDCAGFAADAYARLNGIGAVCVTYCVGGLSLCNSIAGAYAEKSPVVVISGVAGRPRAFQQSAPAPPRQGFSHAGRGLSSHLLRRGRTGRLRTPPCARSIACWRPWCGTGGRATSSCRATWSTSCPTGRTRPVAASRRSDPAVLSEAIAEAVRRIEASQKPVIIAGVEVHRFDLQDELLQFAEGAGIPITATMLGKSVIGERHPLFVGIYEGALGREEVTQFVEESDCVLLLGEFMTDINMGMFTANLVPAQCIYATNETLRISHHHFNGVLLGDFIRGLSAAGLKAPPRQAAAAARGRPTSRSNCGRTIRSRSAADRAAERGPRMKTTWSSPTRATPCSPPANWSIHRQTEFISPAYYTSMGFAVPAALGAIVARPNLRPIVLVGDGAFQMTGMELSYDRPARLLAGGDRPGQPGLRHRTATPSRRAQVQQHPAVALPPSCRRSSAAAAVTTFTPKAISTRRCKPPGRRRADALAARPPRRQRSQPDARAPGRKAARAGMRTSRHQGDGPIFADTRTGTVPQNRPFSGQVL